jgi:hypothetical protein
MRAKTSYAQCPRALEVERTSLHSALLTFAENAIEVSAPDGSAAWEADVYTLIVPWQKDLYDLVEGRYNDWIAHAKDRDCEAEAAKVRAERNARLAATDYIMRDDYPASTEYKRLVADYCNALRALPEQPGFPYDAVWPEPPTSPTKAAQPLTAERVDELHAVIDTMLTGGAT